MTDRGAFEREPVALDTRITDDGSTPWPVEANRYRLVAARAWPWANRAVIVNGRPWTAGALGRPRWSPAFSANLPTTSLDEEIARRKKRAERFGLSAEESETLKSLERQKRFGIVREKKQIKGLDEALPVERERKRRGELQPQQQQGRAGKRGRFENAASLQQQQDGTRRGGRGKGNGAVESGRVQKPAQTSGLSAEDKKRAEERRKRFAV